MAVASGTWYNADGLFVRFPNYYRDPANKANRLANVKTFGTVEQLEVIVDLTQIPTGTTSFSTDRNNDGTADGFNDGDPRIPANSAITNVRMVTIVAAAGGTSFTVGTYSQAGATISANSLVTATAGAVANFAAAGSKTAGDGALTATTVGTAGVGTTNAYVGITTSGTFTAGQILLIVEYVPNHTQELDANT